MHPRLLVGLILAGTVATAGLFVWDLRRGSGSAALVWGGLGVQDGDFARPRAAAIDPEDRLYIVDFAARIQVFDLDGHHLGQTWTTPDFRNGRPSGLGIDHAGHLIVCDSHYHTVRIYDHEGHELWHFGGLAGSEPGEFGYVSDCVQDAEGFYYISEFGENDRITKLDSHGVFVKTWGENGVKPGQFSRVRALALGPDGNLYIADACNHRVQVFTREGELVRVFGSPGSGPGELSYPYDLTFAPNGMLYVVEYGNGRVQKFTPEGEPLGTWGKPGTGPGELANPWAVVADRFGRLHVIDTQNHRVQRMRF